jgi:hypothetical protein
VSCALLERLRNSQGRRFALHVLLVRSRTPLAALPAILASQGPSLRLAHLSASHAQRINSLFKVSRFVIHAVQEISQQLERHRVQSVLLEATMTRMSQIARHVLKGRSFRSQEAPHVIVVPQTRSLASLV